MGKEWWLYWGGSTNRTRKRASSGGETPSSSGCMNAVFQIFDLNHYFPFPPLNHPTQQQPPSFNPNNSFLPAQDPILLKGVEAPRNSLELDEPFIGATSLSSPTVKDENLNIPTGIQIRTSTDARSSRTDDFSSEFSSSPGIKTPNLVARLMGLDLLPESSSPSSSSLHSFSNPQSKSRPKPHIQNLKEDICSRKSRSKNCSEGDFSGTRSLPETPRISSARRSDVDNHRYSLQINKENNNEEIEFSSYLTAKMTRRIVQEDENRSPGHYARKIVKQVKENISRRIGTDITNTVKNREQRRDQELVVLLKSKKLCNQVNGEESCSPKVRFLDNRENKPMSSSPGKIQKQNPHSPKLSILSPLSSTSTIDKYSQCGKATPKLQKSSTDGKCKKVGNEKYSSRLKKPQQTWDLIRNKQDEPFVRSPPKSKPGHSEKKCKQTPLSNNFLNMNVPTTRLSQYQGGKQSQVDDDLSSKRSSKQLSRKASHSYTTHKHTVQTNSNDNGSKVISTTNCGAEVDYISTILKRTGIHSTSSVSFTNWYSPSHPLDPSIFHHLEINRPTTTVATSALDHRSNRKLVFEVVDELLAEFLKPYINLKPWIASSGGEREMNGSQLIERLCGRIREFPSANCEVLEDIDGLIGDDLRKSERRSMVIEEESESEGIVMEIEREIVETLVDETAMVVWGVRTL
ncbi:hypothetical protein LguiB_003592 [Lonicera macranthoides]